MKSCEPHVDTEHRVVRLLLSHHPPHHLHRTVALSWGNRRIRLCARCLGILTGALAFLALCVFSLLPAFSTSACLLLVFIAASPAPVDFYLQLIHRRESTNRRRLLTGAAFGASLALALRHALAVNPLPLLLVPLGLSAYFVWILSSPPRSRAFWRHLLPYVSFFHRCREEDRVNRIRRLTRLPGSPL